MTLRRIGAETLLTPPEPPEGHQDRRKVRYELQVAEKWALAHKYQRTVAR